MKGLRGKKYPGKFLYVCFYSKPSTEEIWWERHLYILILKMGKNSRGYVLKTKWKVKRQSQLKQNSYIALVKYLIHTVLVIMLAFLSQNCSEDHILYKYSYIIITLVISFNCIFNNFSIDTHMGFGIQYCISENDRWNYLNTLYEEAQAKFFSKYS